MTPIQIGLVSTIPLASGDNPALTGGSTESTDGSDGYSRRADVPCITILTGSQAVALSTRKLAANSRLPVRTRTARATQNQIAFITPPS